MGTRETIQANGVAHSDGYEDLSPEQKKQIDAIIAFLSGKTVAEMKRLLGVARLEIDFRSFLNHPPDFQGHQIGS